MKLRAEGPHIVDIKRHSLEDGPGIRTVVFFKGCPMRCTFCQNPETQNPGPEIAFSSAACIGCGACETRCPAGAVSLATPGRIIRNRCTGCGACAEACPGNGLRLIGKRYHVDELMEIVLRDRAYYRHSGGGVTLSGGECTMHHPFLESFLINLKAENIHVVLETSGHFDYQAVSQNVLPYVDCVYYDIKIIDSRDHCAATGRSNTVILENFWRLVKECPEKVFPRIPLVPGITATEGNLRGIVDFLDRCGARNAVLLPYNPAGRGMYEQLGKPAPSGGESFMRIQDEYEIREFVKDYANALIR